MSDPYKILGVSPTSSDEEVKAAYRTLAKKYHPDNYTDSPIADLASEKMKEINEAYDEIMNERKNRKNGYSQPGYSGTGYPGSSYTGSGYAGSDYVDVRNLIVSGRLADAEQILDGVPPENRNAEWYFLKGTVLYKRGWLDEAYEDFARACQMNPGNNEYRAALNQVANQRSGMYGGYNPRTSQAGGCNGCDICTTLCVADACCDCCGGGVGPCC